MSNEVIAPTTATFAEGNDVIGLGTSLPAELAAWTPYGGTYVLKSALIFYSSDWSATATYGQVKYWFIAFGNVTSGTAKGESDFYIGCCYVTNASNSTTGVIRPLLSAGMTAANLAYNNTYNGGGGLATQVADDDSGHDASWKLQTAAGTATVQAYTNLSKFGAAGGAVKTTDTSGNLFSQI